MSDATYPYADIREVRNVGRRRANLLLREGWVLLDWQVEQRIESKELPGRDGQPPETMHFKTQMLNYVLGRPHDVVFTSDDLYAAEEETARERRERPRVGGDTEGM